MPSPRPYVRIEPNVVSANTTEALSAIYLAKAPVLKSGFYNAFAPGFPSSFTTNDKEYRQKKQILSPAFAPRKLEAMEPLIRFHIDMFCKNIEAAGQVDLDVMLGALSIDILSDLCFGKCFDTLNNEKERDLILEGMEKSVQMVLKEGTMHRWPKVIWNYVHSKGDVVKRKYVYQKAIGAMMEKIGRGDGDCDREDIFSTLLHAKQPETGEPYNQHELMGESILLLVAGSDTTSTALTVILWHLLANPKTMEKLTSEICGTFSSVEDIKYKDLKGLPYLHAVIEEGLRICPPNPGLIPRVVMDRSPGNLVIGEHVFPPGTEIGVCNISLHLNSKYFDNPKSFQPERWLQDSALKCEKAAFSPFSLGPRACLGRNMAYMEMSLTLALLAFRLKLSFTNPEKELQDGFDVEDAFVALKPKVRVQVAKV
ncbi:hypothetical protein VE03_05239 [Pseudogymnoascus sp. 23342-1-I1]|nr:hypothetical protein VE03_05239 [Pseudogymnoascus sp. 23342-1-I1]